LKEDALQRLEDEFLKPVGRIEDDKLFRWQM
jgi:hypothetical protein